MGENGSGALCFQGLQRAIYQETVFSRLLHTRASFLYLTNNTFLKLAERESKNTDFEAER